MIIGFSPRFYWSRSEEYQLNIVYRWKRVNPFFSFCCRWVTEASDMIMMMQQHLRLDRIHQTNSIRQLLEAKWVLVLVTNLKAMKQSSKTQAIKLCFRPSFFCFFYASDRQFYLSYSNYICITRTFYYSTNFPLAIQEETKGYMTVDDKPRWWIILVFKIIITVNQDGSYKYLKTSNNSSKYSEYVSLQ